MTHNTQTKMFSPFHLKALHPLQVFSPKSSPSSSSLSSTKLKDLIHTLIVSHMCRLIRALSKVKTIILDIIRDNNSNIRFPHKKHCSKTNKIILGSFRLHYNWCSSKSSHVLPVTSRVYKGLPPAASGSNSTSTSTSSHWYYDSNLKTVIPSEQKQQQQQQQEQEGGAGEDWHDLELAGYLQWLEEKVHDDDNDQQEINEIDVLAEMFIANCHEKFRLEKQESDRRFQEILARGL